MERLKKISMAAQKRWFYFHCRLAAVQSDACDGFPDVGGCQFWLWVSASPQKAFNSKASLIQVVCGQVLDAAVIGVVFAQRLGRKGGFCFQGPFHMRITTEAETDQCSLCPSARSRFHLLRISADALKQKQNLLGRFTDASAELLHTFRDLPIPRRAPMQRV